MGVGSSASSLLSALPMHCFINNQKVGSRCWQQMRFQEKMMLMPHNSGLFGVCVGLSTEYKIASILFRRPDCFVYVQYPTV